MRFVIVDCCYCWLERERVKLVWGERDIKEGWMECGVYKEYFGGCCVVGGVWEIKILWWIRFFLLFVLDNKISGVWEIIKIIWWFWFLVGFFLLFIFG